MFLIVLLLSDNWHKDHIQWVRIVVGNQEISTFVTYADRHSINGKSLIVTISFYGLWIPVTFKNFGKSLGFLATFRFNGAATTEQFPDKAFFAAPRLHTHKKTRLQQVIPVPWFVYFRKSASSEEIERKIKTERRSSPPCTLNMWAHPQCPPRQQKATL